MTELVWGIHMKEMCKEPVDDGFVGIGWKTIGDLSDLPNDRDEIKACVRKHYPYASSGRISAHASVLHDFLHGVSVGDIVVYPDVSKPRMVHIGRVTGVYQYFPDGHPYPSRRPVDWIVCIRRDDFSESARSAISARKTFFEIKDSAEFCAAIGRGVPRRSKRKMPSHGPNQRSSGTSGDVPSQNIASWGAAAIRSNPEKTKERIRCLEEYIRKNLLSGGGSFICEHFMQCRGSRSGFPFHHGQMSHVGRHYDLEVDGSPMRIVLVGQEYGKAQECVSLAKRSERIALSAGKGFRSRNPHMRGTSSTLRLLLGREPGDDEDGERLLDGHIFDGFALVNYLLCTALKKPRNKAQDARGAGQGNSSRVMRQNCGRHFRNTLEILEPTVIVAQGIGVRKWMSSALPIAEKGGPHETVSIAGQSVDLFTFSHPSAGGPPGFWGNSSRSSYLMEIVAPAIQRISCSKVVE